MDMDKNRLDAMSKLGVAASEAGESLKIMRYEIKYTLQKEVTVTIDVADEELNKQFEKLGEITSDKDFKNEYDPRWKIEAIAYGDYSSCGDNVDENHESEAIVDRTIKHIGK